MSIGQNLLLAIAKNGTLSDFYNAKLTEDYFPEGIERDLYKFFVDHAGNYGKLPSLDTIDKETKTLAVTPPEPFQYYLDKVENRYGFNLVNHTLNNCQSLLKSNNIDGIVSTLEKLSNTIKNSASRFDVLNLAVDGAKVLLAEYISAFTKETTPIFSGWDSLDKRSNGLAGGDILSFIGRPGAGKAQPLTAKVLTKNGFVRMGDISVGMELASVDGEVSYVTGVFPQGKKQTYTITFNGGSKTECCGEHLWEVHYRGWSPKTKILNTLEILSLLEKKRYQGRLSVSLYSGSFGSFDPLPLDPYLMGVLLGDGCFRGNCISLSTSDQEIVDTVNTCLYPNLKLSYRSGYDYAVIGRGSNYWVREHNEVLSYLKDVGLWGKKSIDKYIPECFLLADYDSRLALLQGLMDTDGTVGKNGGVSFSSSSAKLASQVVSLVRSLGGYCSSGIRVKKTKHADNYIVHLRFNNPRQSFRLSRKVNSLPETNQYSGFLKNVIKGIKPSNTVECQCISVSHPSKLYVTDDYVVTHNTFMTCWLSYQANMIQNKSVVYVSMEMSPLEIAQRMMGIHTSIDTGLIKGSKLTTKSYEVFKHGLASFTDAGNDFRIVDGNLRSRVEDIAALLYQHKPDLLVVDGAYLLKHSNPRLDRFTRVAENIEMLKALVSAEDIPMIASYQFSRSASKKKPTEQVGLDDIGYSDAIGQISSLVLGLLQPDTAASIASKEISVLKGRHGESGKFNINWNFSKMDFSEVLATPESDEIIYD